MQRNRVDFPTPFEHVHEHAVRNARIHVAQHLMFPVGEAHMFDIYTQILRSLVMR